jgi:Na+-driven multidrug efflux pump
MYDDVGATGRRGTCSQCAYFFNTDVNYSHFAFTFGFGVIGIAMGSAIGMLVGAIIILYRWYRLSGLPPSVLL